MRLSKHQEFTHSNISIKFNTINHKENKSIYITFKAWLTPNDDNVSNYVKYARILKHNLRTALLTQFNKEIYIGNKIIFDYSFHVDRMIPNKPSFINVSITLYPHIKNQPFKLLYNESKEGIGILTNIIMSDHNFTVKKNKK